MNDVGQGRSRYVDPKTGELRTRIGAVNYGAVAGIENYRNQLPPAQRAQADAALRAMGLMPDISGGQWSSYNGPPGSQSRPTDPYGTLAPTGGGAPALLHAQRTACTPSSW